jgi:hypothetical protein
MKFNLYLMTCVCSRVEVDVWCLCVVFCACAGLVSGRVVDVLR